MPASPPLHPRKVPRQERAQATDRLILEAAALVLVEEGAAAFNTNRVAERAGVSVGSLYQYYPNKQALLFRLHVEESGDTTARVAALLRDGGRPPRDRFRAATRCFFETEAAELPIRQSLAAAEIYFGETDAFGPVRKRMLDEIRRFLREAQPERRGRRDFDAELVATVVSSVSERVTNQGVRGAALRRWADTCSDMLCRQLGIAD